MENCSTTKVVAPGVVGHGCAARERRFGGGRSMCRILDNSRASGSPTGSRCGRMSDSINLDLGMLGAMRRQKFFV